MGTMMYVSTVTSFNRVQLFAKLESQAVTVQHIDGTAFVGQATPYTAMLGANVLISTSKTVKCSFAVAMHQIY